MGNAPEWRAIGQSVRGASHLRSGLPNQDSIRWLPASRVGPPLILAVSDGHGSAKSFRSDVGSRLAAEETAWLIQDLLDGQPDPSNLSAIKRTAEERLPREVVRRWQEAVAVHLHKNPFTEEELETLEKKRDAKARRTVEQHPRLAYGATILAVLVTQNFILYIQLGDGDILTVMEDGSVSRPLPSDERLFANETTSLCMDRAWHEVRFRFQTLYGPQPAMILLSSDGYANSFVDEAAFLKVGSDILDILRSEGPESVEASLETWLKDASKSGSGDDITLGILFRTNILDTTEKKTSGKKRPATSKPEPEKPKPKPKPEPQPEPETELKPKSATELEVEPEPPKQTEVTTKRKPSTDEHNDKEKTTAKRIVKHIKNEGPREPSKKLPNLFVDE